jgi:AraC-like DNA-binding protein
MLNPITQSEALRTDPCAADEHARFFTAPRFPGLELLSASFRTHAYALHAHETYTIGTVEAGCETWTSRGARHYAGPGEFALNTPLDVHDGAPLDDGYTYRMSYPSVALMRDVASSVSGRTVTATPLFHPMIHDPGAARLFSAAHAMLEDGSDALAGEELLLRAYASLLVRHAAIAPAPIGREAGPVARVRAAIEARYAEDLALSELAGIACLSVHHLIRVFRAELGLTPHAYLVDVRVRRARDLLRAGLSPAAAAGQVGFADQAHLTRAFKARIGVTPGAYLRAVCRH